MNRTHVGRALRAKAAVAAPYRCGYCLTTEANVGIPMEIEHIIPESLGGPTTEDNLWLACPPCNAHKANRRDAVDPETGSRVALFDPRRQLWAMHFEWSSDGTVILGRTPTGRATMRALDLNRVYLVRARQRWWQRAGIRRGTERDVPPLARTTEGIDGADGRPSAPALEWQPCDANRP